jgi:NTE family protein
MITALDEALDGVTGSSAGAVNAVALAHGLTVRGRAEAKETLQRVWRRLSERTSQGILQPSLIEKIDGRFGLEHSSGYLFPKAVS